jgi:tetratricopeptide (TPR) repeat protein
MTLAPRRYDEAIGNYKRPSSSTNFLLTHIFLYACFYEKGMHRETIPHIVKGLLYFHSPEETSTIEKELTAALAASGKMGLWKKVLDFMKSPAALDYNYPYTMAETYMRLGDRDQAFHWLQKAYDVKHPGLAALKVEPAMDGLRDDPRFAELLRRVNP